MNNDKIEYRKLIEKLFRILILLINKKDVKRLLFYDGVLYSIKMINHAYDNLVKNLCILADFQFQDPTHIAESAIAEAWSIVDSLYRLRRLLEDTPGIKQKSPHLQIFYRKTKLLKSLRNSIQHLDDTIETYICDKIPAWGRLSWIYPKSNNNYKACMIAPGNIQPDWKLFPSHMGKKMRGPIDFITLTTNKEICLTHMIDSLEQLMPWLNQQLNNYFDQKHQLIVACASINTNYNILL